MRSRAAAVVGLLLLAGLAWWGTGPLGLLLLVAVGCAPRVRRRLARLRPARPWRAGVLAVVALAVLAVVLVVLPRTWLPLLPVPPGPGALVVDEYDGRPVAARPLTAVAGPGPDRPADASPVDRAGPMGDLPVRSATWTARGECSFVSADLRPVPVLLCADGGDGRLVRLDPASLEQLALLALGGPASPPCRPVVVPVGPGATSGLLAVTADRQLLDVETEEDLTVVRRRDLARVVEPGDCPLDLVPTSRGAWLLTTRGAVVHVPRAGRPRLLAGAAGPASSADGGGGLAVADGTAYVVSGGRLRAFDTARTAGGPRWETDLGAAATAPSVLPGGRVAVGLRGGARAELVVLDAATGAPVCRTAVFEDGAGRVAAAPVVVGDALLLANDHDDAGEDDGLARVRVGRAGCAVSWTTGRPAAAPPTVSRRTGLAYVVEHDWTAWLLPVTRLAAVDVRTGERAFATLVGTGSWAAPEDTAPALGPGGAAYVVTRGGLVRVTDR